MVLEYWPWVVWWLCIFVSFAGLERLGFAKNPKFATLSRFMNMLGKWPLSIGLIMFVLGGLCVHFWWNWCPDLMPPGQGG